MKLDSTVTKDNYYEKANEVISERSDEGAIGAILAIYMSLLQNEGMENMEPQSNFWVFLHSHLIDLFRKRGESNERT